jgi:Stage II sporulation protein M
MDHRDLALVQGIDHTRTTLRRWNAAPSRVVVPWAVGSFLVACALLYVVWAISHRVTPDTTHFLLPGLNAPATPAALAHIVARNSLVLALHAAACVAGYIAGSALPAEAERHHGVSGWVHRHAGRAAIAFVAGATIFSLATQAYVLGSAASTLAAKAGIGQATLILTLLPHALPELTALFLPLAAWLVASRRGRFEELLAATAVTTVIAVPMLVVAAAIEIWVWPHLLLAASPVA